MSGPFEYSRHIVRMLGLYGVWVASFLVVRAMLIPERFGEHGHYRPAAVEEAAALEPVYAGRAACLECHDNVSQDREQNRHASLSCEICHGTLAAHAADFAVTPTLPEKSDALCLGCHLAGSAKPQWFKQVIPGEHFEGESCAECHPPHQP